MTASTKIIEHPLLGSIRGQIEGDNIVTFRNLPYASIPFGRFTQSLVRTDLPNAGSTYDATKAGPLAPQLKDSIDFEFLLFQASLENDLYVSEDECLHLTIAAPKGSSPSSGYPVMVWIHGGDFRIGSCSWPQYDPSNLAKHAAVSGKPTVIVSINYRVGIFGFLASKDLEEDAKALGQDGVGNMGLRDQQRALEWIQVNIGGFGGDPKKVTLFGESAGAGSVNLQMVMKGSKGLFSQTILMSGSAGLTGPISKEFQETLYEQLLTANKVTVTSGKERLSALRKIPVDKLIASVPSTFLSRPTLDNVFFPQHLNFGGISNGEKIYYPDWVDGFMVGAAKDDGSIFSINGIKPNAMQTLTDLARVALPESQLQKFLKTFGISPKNNKSAALDAFTKLASVVMFITTATNYAKMWPNPSKSFLYYFNQGNPFPGQFQGYATHAVDGLYLFQCFNDQFPAEEDVAVAKSFATAFITFANREKPFPAIGTEGYVKLWGGAAKDGKVAVLRDNPNGTAAEIAVVEEIGVDKVFRIILEYLKS